MGFLDDHLLPGERIIHRARLHWIVFGVPLLLLVLGVAVGGLLQRLAGDYWYVGLGFAALALVFGLAPLLRYVGSEYAITDKRVLAKQGIIQRDSVETLLSKVEAITVGQDVWGRLLNYGTIIVTGTGGTREAFSKIAAPLEFRRQVQAQIVALDAVRVAVPVAAGPGEQREERECPFCAERILVRAKVCKHCGRDVPAA